jgi:cytochrome c oxidase assembly protein subunit 15
MAATTHPGLHRFALFTAAATFLLIIAGALVTSNDAGLSVPDWPLSYGQLMPPMIGGIFYEHGHRMIASFVGLLTIVLAVWLWRVEERGWVKRLGWAALGLVIAQGVLGGLTVIFLLPTAVSVGHACLAQLFFSAVVVLALVTSPGWRRGIPGLPAADEGSPSLRTLCVAANAAIFVQLLLGAAFRHKGSGIIPHLVGAAIVAVLVVWVIARVVSSFPGQARLFRWALTLNALVMLQLVLGSGAYWIRQLTADYPQPLLPMVALTVAHVALGALILATSVVLTFEVWAGVSRPSPDFADRKVVTAA